MFKKNKITLCAVLALTACGSDPLLNPYGGNANDQLNNANLEMSLYRTKPTAEMVARHNVENAIKEFSEKNDSVGLGNAYNTYGKIYKVFDKDYAKDIEYQQKAISYYQQTNYNPGLAVSYGELYQVAYLNGDKPAACTYVAKAIEKFEAAKTTHPGIVIPMYTKGFGDFGGFSRESAREMGCTN